MSALPRSGSHGNFVGQDTMPLADRATVTVGLGPLSRNQALAQTGRQPLQRVAARVTIDIAIVCGAKGGTPRSQQPCAHELNDCAAAPRHVPYRKDRVVHLSPE